jgi:hypothetical protein
MPKVRISLIMAQERGRKTERKETKRDMRIDERVTGVSKVMQAYEGEEGVRT